MIISDYKQIDNCSTIIVGKNASKTGKVLLAHNEDDMNCIVQTHVVQRKTHPEGEVLVFEDADGVIPQVAETCKYIWSEYRCPGKGESFADGYANEYGVVVVSNSCVSSKISHTEEVKKGIGYGLRKLIAERAHSAREGVEIAAQLLETYGYRAARSYAIVDKDEGWFFQATTGTNFVARKMGDDEVGYIPNWFTIHEIDFTDTEHKQYYWSKEIVDYPMRNGWYTPAVEGDYSDFDFAKVYQGDGSYIKSNIDRSNLAWTKLTGAPQPHTIHCVKAPKMYSVEDMKSILRSHYVEHEDDLKEDPTMSPHRYGICRDTTEESIVVEFTDAPETSVMWRAAPRPCANPYIPWFFGLDKAPAGYEWNTPEASVLSHHRPDDEEFSYDKNKAYWAFHTLQNVMEFNYQFCAEKVHGDIAKMEAEWAKTVPSVIETYNKLDKVNHDYAVRIVSDYTLAQCQKVWDWALQETVDLADMMNKSRMNFWRSKL